MSSRSYKSSGVGGEDEGELGGKDFLLNLSGIKELFIVVGC